MSITSLPTPPTRSDPSTFASRGDSFFSALPTFVTETNALASSLNSIAAGGAMTIPYTFSTTTTDADPGAGYVRFSSATQNTTTTVRVSTTGADSSTWTDVLDSFSSSSSTVKGQLRFVKTTDATKWIVFNITAIASPTGYRNITVSVVGSSSANPFSNNDSLVMHFTRTGDQGSAGNSALTLIASSTVGSPAANVDFLSSFSSTYDNYLIIIDNLTFSGTDALRLRMANSGVVDSTANNYRNLNMRTDGTSMVPGSLGDDKALITGSGTYANTNRFSLFFEISQTNSATPKHLYSKCIVAASAAPVEERLVLNYLGSAVSGFRLYGASGTNISSGTIKIYGISKS